MNVDEVRSVHRPVQAPCGCSRWVCRKDALLWPCEVETQVRAAGHPPIGIDDYPV